MRQIALLLVAATSLLPLKGALRPAGSLTSSATSSADFKIPHGYRDWSLISVAHEGGNLNDIRAVLGNGLAVKALREDKRTLPDGAVIARLAWTCVSSEQNNKAFGRQQSFVAGPPTNVQFMVKDSTKYSASGGWGFAQFKDGTTDATADLKSCFPCHAKNVKGRDFIFTRYAP